MPVWDHRPAPEPPRAPPAPEPCETCGKHHTGLCWPLAFWSIQAIALAAAPVVILVLYLTGGN